MSSRWARRLERRKQQRQQKHADESAFNAAIEEASLDSGASCTLVQSSQGMELTGPSNRRVVTAGGQILQASSTALLPTTTLSAGAREAHVLEGLQPKALLSVKTLADNGYTTIFHPHDKGVTVHGIDDLELTFKNPALLHGWRKGGGLWTVPIVDEPMSSPGLDGDDAAMNVHDLPSTKEVVRFLHAALGFPTKATLLNATAMATLLLFQP
eukprot:scaffold3198_cov213-Alexandrium_tamarense.AAC.34